MAYNLPNFNMNCAIYPCNVANTPAVPLNPPRIAMQSCQLCHGKRVNVRVWSNAMNPRVTGAAMSLLLPKGADIRGPQDTVSIDMVEVPVGSARWYWVNFVDDVAKGFANEYREAIIVALSGSWVAPYP